MVQSDDDEEIEAAKRLSLSDRDAEIARQMQLLEEASAGRAVVKPKPHSARSRSRSPPNSPRSPSTSPVRPIKQPPTPRKQYVRRIPLTAEAKRQREVVMFLPLLLNQLLVPSSAFNC